ncbi:MAG: ABC transporter permease subunit [Actinobacteria bacterium]|nr:ABC transporter permease subunit [Actinomycetota bacterium]
MNSRVAGSLNKRARHLAFAPYAIFLLVFLVWPGLYVFRSAFDQGSAPKNPMIEAVTGQYRSSFIFSLRLSFVSAILGLVIGATVAVALMRLSHVRGLRNVVVGYSAVAANMGGIPLAFAFLAAFGMQGLATRLLKGINIDLIGWGFRISDFWGIVLVYLYFQIPLMTLVIVPALDGLRRTWSEAAQSLGASTRQYWRFVALPILTPALLGGFLLLVANAFAAYATAFALSAGSSKLVTVQIRFFLQGETITGKTNLGYALAAWMVIITAFLVLGFQVLSRRAERWRR